MALLKLKCTACSKITEELTEKEKIAELKCAVCGAPLERAYEGKALFGMASKQKDIPAQCHSCPHGCHH